MCHIRKKPRFSEVLPETMAVHYWGGSWIQSSDELLAELQKRIDYLENILSNDLVSMRKELEVLRGIPPLQRSGVCQLKKDKEEVN